MPERYLDGESFVVEERGDHMTTFIYPIIYHCFAKVAVVDKEKVKTPLNILDDSKVRLS